MKNPKDIITPNVIDIFKHYNIVHVDVFGSYARGDFTQQSDIDLLCTFEKPISLVQFSQLKEALKRELGRDVDVLSTNALVSPMKNMILAEAISIYGHGERL